MSSMPYLSRIPFCGRASQQLHVSVTICQHTPGRELMRPDGGLKRAPRTSTVTHLGEGLGQVKAGLAAHGGEDGVRALLMGEEAV